MSFQDLGAIGELIGSIAVLITVVYLALQVRHGKELLERSEKIALSQVYQARVDSRRELERLVIEHSELITRMLEGSIEDVSSSDKRKLRQIMSLWADWWDNNIYQESLGLMSSDDWFTPTVPIEQLLEMWSQFGIEPSPRMTAWVKSRQQSASEDK